ncbi:MAG: LysR family transcriptional regulator [Rhodocyclaceae bacterium]|nr:LysR family transcriptional regulator [Rhodocyclaceae bacterium]
MDLTQLKIFQTVVHEGGITKAAHRLHRVQSNVTTRIRQFENELGVALFERDGKRLHLTAAGQTMLDYAERLLALAEEARDAVRDPRPRGTFLLGSMESTAAVRLPEPLTEYHRRHPDVDLQLRTGNPQQLARAVLNGEIEAALVAEPVADEPFDKLKVFAEELVLVAAANHPPVDRQHPPATMIAFENGCPHRRRLEQWYADGGQMPSHTIELSSYHAMLGCVIVGMGVALLPRSVLTTFPEHHRLRVNPLPAGLDVADTVLIWRRGARSPNVAALAEILVPGCAEAGPS